MLENISKYEKVLLEEIGVDLEKEQLVFVQFKNVRVGHNLNLYNGKKYVYKADINEDINNGDMLIVPVMKNDMQSLEIVQTNSVVKNGSYFDSNELIKFAESYGASKNAKEIRKIALNIGTTGRGLLKDYYEQIEKEKKKKEILEKLDEKSKKAQKMIMYKELAKNDPEMAKMIEELESL